MYVIEVIPLGKGTPLSLLSYFSGIRYVRGTILSIPIRNKMVPGIVINASEASTTKTALRAATFTLRKLPLQSDTSTLSPRLLDLTDELAQYYATSPGSVLFSLLPKEVKQATVPIHSYPRDTRSFSFVYQIFEASEGYRADTYLGLIRESFANSSSVLLIAPTIADIRRLTSMLSSGIEKHTIVLHSGIGKKQFIQSWGELANTAHPKLIITTPQYGFIDREDIRLVILERSRASGYRAPTRPYIDYRHAYRLHAKMHNRRLISGDIVVRSEEILYLENGTAEPFEEHPRRIALSGTLRSIDMNPKPESEEPFQLFSKKLLRSIEEALEKKERVFLYAARRGLAPVVACIDCGHIFRDPESGAPLSLHRTIKDGVEERWFVCSVSGYRSRARDLCPHCNSWRLKERGIGIQQIYDTLKEHIDHAKIVLFDHTTARTPKAAQDLSDSFFKMKGGILLGTALALPYLKKPVSMSAVTNMDALYATPSWRQGEEILGTLLTLREKTTDTVFIQTRTGATPVLEYATKGRVADFHTEELELRKQFSYPPYAVFIHFTWQGKAKAVKELAEHMTSLFKGEDLSIYTPVPQSEAKEDDTTVRHALMRVPSEKWPHPDMVERIRSLPPSVRVMIDPDRIV